MQLLFLHRGALQIAHWRAVPISLFLNMCSILWKAPSIRILHVFAQWMEPLSERCLTKCRWKMSRGVWHPLILELILMLFNYHNEEWNEESVAQSCSHSILWEVWHQLSWEQGWVSYLHIPVMRERLPVSISSVKSNGLCKASKCAEANKRRTCKEVTYIGERADVKRVGIWQCCIN